VPAPRLPIVPGKRIGKLVVIRRAKRRYFHTLPSGYREPNRMWLCLCDCGRDIFLSTSYINDAVRRGINKSCRVGQCRAFTNGLFTAFNRIRYDRLTGVYSGMLYRCTNPKAACYKNYGALGITVCDRWRGPDGLANFIADMGPRPREKTLDRKNPFLGYSPDNCQWATDKQQGNNRREHYAKLHPDDPSVIAGLKLEAELAEKAFHATMDDGKDLGAFTSQGF
jgi:hypothetical protein